MKNDEQKEVEHCCLLVRATLAHCAAVSILLIVGMIVDAGKSEEYFDLLRKAQITYGTAASLIGIVPLAKWTFLLLKEACLIAKELLCGKP